MTGAGSGELIFGHEDSFLGSLVDSNSDGTPDLFDFGRNAELTELSLDNQLQRLREAGEVEAAESIKQNFEGAVGVTAVVSSDTFNEVEKLVFNDGGTGFTPGLAASGRVFTNVQYPTGTAERELLGVIPIDFSIDYEQGGMVSYSLTMAYADEQPGSSVDLTTATRVNDGTSAPFHGFTLTIDGTSIEDLQSCSLSISEIARFQRGTDPTPLRAVIANPSTTLDATATFTSPSRLELARGAANGPPPDQLDSVTGTVEIAVEGSTVSTYDLPKLKPDSYNWDSVITPDDTTDSTTFHVNGGVTVA
ncbi:phage tail tube protein [Halorussus marinus]|uniref:phage tail tube protein n=1 Tax=Halorussus marinus TaxID=2505976 RepID=UPI0010927D40|nr:hypothetical protein [Halorussus marinus]